MARPTEKEQVSENPWISFTSMIVPPKAEECEGPSPATEPEPARGSREELRAGRRQRAITIVADIFGVEEERLVIEIEDEGISFRAPPNRREMRVSLFIDHEDVTYADRPLIGQEDFYEQARGLCPDRPQGPLTRFERGMEAPPDRAQ